MRTILISSYCCKFERSKNICRGKLNYLINALNVMSWLKQSQNWSKYLGIEQKMVELQTKVSVENVEINNNINYLCF